MKKFANTELFDRLVTHVDNANQRLAIPYDKNSVQAKKNQELADQQRRQDLEEEQRYYAGIMNNPMNLFRLRLIRQRNRLTNLDMPRRRPKIYDHGPGEDIPLETLVSYAQKTPKRIQNIRIYKEDLEKRDFDTGFYGRTLPSLVKYVERYCYRDDGKKLSLSDIYKAIDSPDLFVGRSEPHIIDRLSQLTKKIDAGAFPDPPNMASEVHRELVRRLNKSNIDGYNRQAARQWGIKFSRDLLNQGMDEKHIPDVVASLDWFGKLCDQYKIPVDHVLQGYNMYLYSKKDLENNPDNILGADLTTSGFYDPAQQVIYIRDDSLTPQTITHELSHLIDGYRDLSDRLYGATRRSRDKAPWYDEARAATNDYINKNKQALLDPNTSIFPAYASQDLWRRFATGHDYPGKIGTGFDRNGVAHNIDEYFPQMFTHLWAGRPISRDWFTDFDDATAASGDAIPLKDERNRIRKYMDKLRWAYRKLRNPKS